MLGACMVKFSKYFVIIFIYMISLSACKSGSSETLKQDDLAQAIDKVLAENAHPNAIGIKIQAMQDGKVLYEKNADQAFMPASNLKLFTAAAALTYLGPNYRYQTTIGIKPNTLQNGAIQGNVYLKFTGDPDLDSTQLAEMISRLHALGVRQIDGNIYLDDSAFDDKNYGPGWMWDDFNFCYAAPMSALMLDHNCNEYLLSPTQLNQLVRMESTDKNRNYFHFIENKVFTKNAKEKCEYSLQVTNSNAIKLTGCMNINEKPQTLPAAIKNPQLYTKLVLQRLFEQNKISLQGSIKKGTMPNNAQILVVHNSKSLRLLVNEMLKVSDNLISNSLLRTLGAHYFKQQGTWENGVKAVQAILTENAHINFDKSVIVDGDGQSRYDLVTPNQLSQLLNYVYHNFRIAPEFIAALPIAGSDGSLSERMHDKNILVRAKTGGMTGVDSLSGYVETKNHQILSFVIITNNHIGKSAEMRNLQDKICELLASIS